LISCTLAHLRIAELGCFTSVPLHCTNISNSTSITNLSFSLLNQYDGDARYVSKQIQILIPQIWAKMMSPDDIHFLKNDALVMWRARKWLLPPVSLMAVLVWFVSPLLGSSVVLELSPCSHTPCLPASPEPEQPLSVLFPPPSKTPKSITGEPNPKVTTLCDGRNDKLFLWGKYTASKRPESHTPTRCLCLFRDERRSRRLLKTGAEKLPTTKVAASKKASKRERAVATACKL
jgi:hypothetical protein